MQSKRTDLTRIYVLVLVCVVIDAVFSYLDILTEYMIIPRLIYIPGYLLSGIVIIRDSIRADKERFENTMSIRKDMLKKQFERDYSQFCRELHSK
jgi:hypothetical protein